MIDIKLIRENRDIVKENIKKKFQDDKLSLVDEVYEYDVQYRECKAKGDNLRSEKNKLSSQIGLLMRDKKLDEVEEIKKRIGEMQSEIVSLEEREVYGKLAKTYWRELIRWTPEGWLQTRTYTLNYENLLGMCSTGQRRYHKLTEWSGDGEDFEYESFIKFARSLPYAQDFIFIDEAK
jgi:predicted nuclease with TOPRIM domain